MEFADAIKTPKVDYVVLRRPFRKPIDGTLCVTGHHLILSSRKDNTEELWLLHRNIDVVEKKIGGTIGSLILKCKNFQIIQLDIPKIEECMNIANTIELLSNLDDVQLYYPFFFRPMFDILEDGWQAFLTEAEFSKLVSHTDNWRISHVNKDYSLCPSYPQTVVVPKCIDDETLAIVSSFRQHGRFPVLSYFHNENGMVLMRSSQPLTGTNGRRCKEDERLINAVLGIGKRGYIIDTRTTNMAQFAKAKGGGYEPEVHYPQWRRFHRPIERYPTLQDSLCKLVEACNDTSASMDKWLSRLESSNWLTHIKDVLNCACLVAQCIDKDGASVLVHGSEGLDSTLQVTSLAQVILDPDCRTVRGFEALVEREWLQAGHPFADRCNKSAYGNTRNKQESPVFLLFLDSVWQIYQQFPCSFEFSEQFLLMLFEYSYSSQFGTFLCNNEKERSEVQLGKKTVSLWSYINCPEILQSFLNPLYEPNPSVIWPSVAPLSLVLWSGLFLRWIQDTSMQEEAWKMLINIKDHDKEIRSKAVRLRRSVSSQLSGK